MIILSYSISVLALIRFIYQGKSSSEMQMRRLEARLEAALKDKSDLEQRFGALLAISDASITRMHSPPTDAYSKRTCTPAVIGQTLSTGGSPSRGGKDGGLTRVGDGALAAAAAGGARQVAFSPYRSGELRKSTLVGGPAERSANGAGGDMNEVMNDTQRYEQGQASVARENADQLRHLGFTDKSANLTEAPTPPYGDAGIGGIDESGGLNHTISRPASRMQPFTVALPPPPQLATPSSTTTRSIGLAVSGGKAEGEAGLGRGSVAERLAEFRDTSHVTSRGDGTRSGKSKVVLPSPPAADYIAIAERRDLMDAHRWNAEGSGRAAQESAFLAADGGMVLFDSDKTKGSSGHGLGRGTSPNDSVTEKLRNIHTTFAALRAQSAS